MNVYTNSEERTKYLDKYFTEDGIKSLENRLKALLKIYLTEDKFPLAARSFGFPTLRVHSKKHLEGMIDELKQILGVNQVEVIENERKERTFRWN